MKSDFLIIGGSAAGTTAAEVIRGLKPDATITIVTDENHEQYSRVLIPHYIRGKVTREQVFLKKPEWYAEHKIQLLKGNRVKSLEDSKKLVTLESGEQIDYGKLLIAVGGKVVKFNAPGAELSGIHYMRTIENADSIIADVKKSKSGVIIGGGFIGLEFCSCMKVNGVEKVTVLVMEPYFWQGKLDEDSAKVLAATLEKNGVEILKGEQVDHFVGNGHVKKVVTKSGKEIPADVVGIGVGIKSELGWLEGSGIEIKRAIATNEYLETNLPDVYAAGDCAEFKDVVFNRQHIIGNWANATSQGNAVGKTMAGEKTVFETASSYSINFFDGSCTFIGVTEESFAEEIISRGSVKEGKMTRIFVKTIGKAIRIVGATVINNTMEVGPLTNAIKGKVDIAGHRNKLNDPDFDLRDIIA